jgi:hypothetical protein
VYARASSLALPRAHIGGDRPRLQPFFCMSPALGRVRVPAPAAAASIYSSAILAASLKIATNMGRVSFPVCVFWFEG